MGAAAEGGDMSIYNTIQDCDCEICVADRDTGDLAAWLACALGREMTDGTD